MEGFNYSEYDALGLAELIKNKEIQPKELIEEAINKVEKLNPKLNAVIHKMYDQAREQSDQYLTGTFAGVPMLLKNMTQEIKGEPMTSGSQVLHNYRAKEDSYYVKRLRDAGLIFIGQTNVPEFALMGITEPAHYGPTRNPWNNEVTPGGSSGGSAAAVASGIVPIAGANDGGGSIRIPAAYCGLFGLKPTRGRAPTGPYFGRHWQGASVDHVLTRTVRDSAAMLDELKTYEKTAAFHAAPFEDSYLSLLDIESPRNLKIAYSVSSPLGTEVEEECAWAVMKTAKLLESMGYYVEEKEAPVDGKQLANSFLNLYFGEVAATLHEIEHTLGRKVNFNDVEPTTWLIGMIGNATSSGEFVLSLREWDKAAFIMEQFHETYDLYLTPTTAFTQAGIGELDPTGVEKLLIHATSKLGLAKLLKKVGLVDSLAEKSLKRTPFTQLANLTGQPAMSVPLHMTPEGLPVGVQFNAARGREDLLLQLGFRLEQTDHWVDVKTNPHFS